MSRWRGKKEKGKNGLQENQSTGVIGRTEPGPEKWNATLKKTNKAKKVKRPQEGP